MRKWTEFYGAIREVEVSQNGAGQFTGYRYHAHGAVWREPLAELPSGFCDTAAEAVASVRAGLLHWQIILRERMAWLRAAVAQSPELVPEDVVQWVAEQIASMERSLKAIEQRLPGLEQEVVPW